MLLTSSIDVLLLHCFPRSRHLMKLSMIKNLKVDHMRIFGCLAYAHVPSQQQTKLDAKAVKCIFIGYSPDSKAYTLFNLATNKVITSRDVISDEDSVHPMTDFHKHNYAEGDIFEGLLPGVMPSSSSITDPNLQQGGSFPPSQVC